MDEKKIVTTPRHWGHIMPHVDQKFVYFFKYIALEYLLAYSLYSQFYDMYIFSWNVPCAFMRIGT